MTDRVPTYPGRVRLTPVTGQSNVYDLTREDSPITAGDALNKANLLPDSVAAALGLTGNPQVKDALSALSASIDDLAANSIVTGTYVGTGTATRTISLGFTPRAVLVLEYGNTTTATTSTASYRSGLAITGTPAQAVGGAASIVGITTGGFSVYSGTYSFTNALNYQFSFIAWR